LTRSPHEWSTHTVADATDPLKHGHSVGYILVAFNDPSAVRVYRINRDFTPGEEVQQPSPIDAGIYAHQVRTTPDNRLAILVTRSNPATATKAGDPGALKVFDYRNGLLTKEVSIAPNGGKDFGPRHLDFHPFKPWMYVSIETQNKMFTYLIEDGRINSEIAFREETWAEPNNIRARQAAGTVHVHPNGRFLYGANHCDRPQTSRTVRFLRPNIPLYDGHPIDLCELIRMPYLVA